MSVVIEGVTYYTEKEMEKALGSRGRTVYRLRHDFVIPKGTEFHVEKPGVTKKFLSEHAVYMHAVTKDVTAEFSIDLEDAFQAGLLEKRILL